MNFQSKTCEVFMKKFSIVFATIFTLVLGTVLSACSFKQPSANFSSEEIFVSIGQEVNLEDYLSVSELEIDDVEYAFSNSNFFTLENSTLTANTFGQANVYALYDGNTLDNMHIVVKKPFEQVDNIQMDDNGLVTWNNVIDKFDETQNFTSPSSYQLNITYTNPNTEEANTTSVTVQTNSYQLTEEGRYEISIIALGEGYFDNSQASETILYFGYMPKLQAVDFSFNPSSEVISWAEVSSANFTINFNGQVVAENITENSIDLTDYLSELEAGSYTLFVTTNDANGEKISVESEEVTINKISNASLTYLYDQENGGRYSVSLPENANEVILTLGEKTYNFSENSETTFEDLPQGSYNVVAQALVSESEESGVFYANSDAKNLKQIYKLGKVTIQGTGENEENDTTFNYSVTRADENILTNFVVKLNDNTSLESGFGASDLTVNKNILNLTSGEYNLSILQLASQESVVIDSLTYDVINSDESDLYTFTKLAPFTAVSGAETVSHSYVNENSTFTFNLVEGATEYSLYILNGEDYELVDNSLFSRENGIISFTGKIEELFSEYFESSTITFKLLAASNAENFISSSTVKTLTQLSTPTSSSGNNESTIYSWDAVPNALEYNVRYAVISKDQYDLGLEQIETSDLSFSELVETSDNEITLDAGNYFYIEIFALPENESSYLTSETFRAIFFLSKKLSTPNVDVMYGILGEEDAESYYIRVENVENIEALTVTLGQDESAVTSYQTGEEYTIYRLNSDFSDVNALNGIELSVVAHSTDSVIYLDSLEFKVTIQRLARVEYDELIFDELTKTMTVEGGREGVTEIILSDGTTTETGANVDTSLDVFDIENGDVIVALKGGEIVEDVIQPIDNTIYLDSEVATFNIQRVDRPTNFTYNNGNLTFSATHQFAEVFVLDIILTDANNNQTLFKISNLDLKNNTGNYPSIAAYSKTGEELTLILAEQEIESILLTSNYTIDLDTIISYINLDSTLSNYYSQAVKVEFGIYCRQQTLNNSIFLNSYYGTLLSDTSLTLLEISKMPTLEISYDKDLNTLSWDSLGNDTTYLVYQKGRGVISTSTANSYQFNLPSLTLSQDYTFYVTATSPYYLESSQSNEILIHRLDAVTSVTLSNNNLQFTPNRYDNQYIQSASISINSGESETISKNTNFSLPISENGTYSIKYLGITDYESEGRFYLDSSEVSFNVSEMTTIAPTNNEVTFSNNTISFSPFGEGESLQTLSYRIVFTNSNNPDNTIEVTTKSNSYVVSLDDENLNNLLSGEISISVYAILSTYSVSAGGNVYYSTLESDLGIYNVYKYTSSATINKLAQPTIENVEFNHEDYIDATATTPRMILYVSGNYSENETFYVFIGNSGEIVKQISYNDAYDVDAGNFKLELTFEEYANYMTVGNNEISVVVRSSVNLPSQEGNVTVYRNDTLESITQNSEMISYNSSTINGYNHTLNIEFQDASYLSYATGGIDLVISYTPSGEEMQEETITIPFSSFEEGSTSISYDLTSFFEEKLVNGGTVSYSAYIRSFSDNSTDNKAYFLASQPVQSVSNYEILAMPSESLGLSRTNGGICLVNTDSLINTLNTKYLIQYASSTYIIGQDEDFYFEFPSTWGDGEYALQITAFESGKVKSNALSYTINLSRLVWNENPNITLYRDASEEEYLEWDEVTNANSYLVRAYDANGNLINEIEIVKGTDFLDGEKPSFTMTDIFGDDYNLLQNYGYTYSGAEIRFDIIACNHSETNPYYTDSAIYSVNCSLLGSGDNLSRANISVNSEGFITFIGETGTTYLYTLVPASAIDETVFEWQEITSDVDGLVAINLSLFENLEENTVFNLQIKKKGDALNSGVIYNTSGNTNLSLDSIIVESAGFRLSDSVRSVAFDSVNLDLLTIALSNEYSRVFVSQQELYDENLLTLANAVELNLTSTDVLEGTNYLYTINYIEILDAFNFTSGQNTVYLYAIQESFGGDYTNTLSFVTSFEFTIDDTTQIVAVEKMEDTLESFEEDNRDRSKTQIGFTYDENIVGFYFRVDYTSPTGTEASFKYSYGSDEFILDTLNNRIYLDLSSIFNNEEINQGAGNYKLSISVLKSIDENVVISNYITSYNDGVEDIPLEFTKLPELSQVYLSSGNLYWTVNTDLQDLVNLADGYYIYLVSVENESAINKYKTDSITTSYDGELFSASYSQYNVYVIAIANDPFVIASNPKYIQENDGTIKNVAKGRFNSELTLNTAGVLSINWDSSSNSSYNGDVNNDIYALLNLPVSSMTSANVNAFVDNIFFYPFTFTVNDLVNGQVRIRFRFISSDASGVKYTETVTVDALYLLQALDLPNLSQLLDHIYSNVQDATDRTLVSNFRERIETYCGGIGNEVNIFDEFFERIQSGKYQIEYCLLGNSSTFNSAWYSLKRSDAGQEEDNSVFYVNPMPKVTAAFEESTDTESESIARAFYLRISQANVYTDAEGNSSLASTYILRMESSTDKYGFEISNMSGNWTCKLIGDEGETFDVEVDGNDLILYLNLNGANSLKSKYSDILSSTDFTFEIFAQGNSYSISSKSERFELSYNGACHDFHIENGTFIWQSHQNYPTKVVYKLDLNTTEQEETISNVTSSNMTLTLDTAGLYDYIKFVTQGSISGNTIRVDSETYMIENVYKLNTPTLQTDLNMIRVSEAEGNISNYAEAYSQDDFKKYEIYNDVSTNNLSFKYTDLNIDELTTYYEPGTTFYSTTSQDYAYKSSELTATSYSISSLGSTADFEASERQVSDGVTDHDVYIFNIDYGELESQDKNTILLRSTTGTINARMLNSVSQDSLSIQNGVVSWSEGGILEEGENLNLVYKITLSFYDTSIDSNGETAVDFLPSENNIERYTALTQFDISKEAENFPQADYSYIRITVQALALNITDEEPSNNNRFEELVEGGYISGTNISFSDGTYVLMSNGVYLENITLSNPVENIAITNGQLTWTYATNENVEFIVEDENGNTISGTLSSTLSEEFYIFTFKEDVGALSAGEHTLTVYAVQTGTSQDNLIKSVGASVSGVLKIASMSQDGYQIYTETLSIRDDTGGSHFVDVETLDFSQYFTNNQYNNVTLTVTLTNENRQSFTLTSSNSKIYVFSSEEELQDFRNNYSDYIDTQNCVAIATGMTFIVTVTGEVDSAYQEQIFLLPADEFTLNLQRPEYQINISYDAINQIFSWTTDSQDEEGLVYVVNIAYNEGSSRTYEITENSFVPTVIGNITEFRVAVKFGENALMSSFVDFEDTDDDTANGLATFNLFASGDGTGTNPYTINNTTQFRNIAYRMSKATYLNSYTQNGQTQTESTIFYFQLGNDIGLSDDDLLQFNGILFKGTFEGALLGANHTIVYTSTYSASSAALTSAITVSIGRLTGLTTGENAVYSYGLSLFESLGTTSTISNLTIQPIFNSENNVGVNLLVAGLTITNSGTVSNVNAAGLESNLVIYTSSQGRIGAYAGLVSINNGSLNNCALTADINLTDTQGGVTRNQNFYVGGLVYTNYGNIRQSSLNANITLDIQSAQDATRHQIAGIAVTSGLSSSLSGNSIGTDSESGQTYQVSFIATSSNNDTVYVAGISVYCLAQGTNYTGNSYNSGCAVASTTSGSIAISDEINPTL